eukprot:CAMPEP_0201490572 /NCGR_PEP_ID=MMETSP0151_2-20130828/26639_1 /ASSEMBLY_ACC=CAM_ASM_000257 /TAXON_ID=200890 /ORGANISM="Paramoeba atlantica, Strain 621/1 / CCAP 1560/9" /LENGTH=50 /DNA_ID=CAMNT_0047876573 /DNA_START=112 /DNA_END=264 /DNA_ORIENTATION=+
MAENGESETWVAEDVASAPPAEARSSWIPSFFQRKKSPEKLSEEDWVLME